MTIKEVSERYEISPDTLRYYERVGAIPPVTRSSSGVRDYQDTDLAWVELAICMRAAGLAVDVLTQYVELTQQGDSTILARLELLTGQREELLAQQRQIQETLDKLNYKISHYEDAVKTGVLVWEEDDPE